MSFQPRRGPPPAADTATAAALRLLTRRALSTAELASRLQARGYDAATAAAAVAAMQRYGYVNDLALAQACAADAERSGRGPAWVQQKLQQRQVHRDTAAAAAATTYADAAAATARALSLLRRRLARRPAPAEAAAARAHWQRALRFLLRRGFSFASAQAAVRQLGDDANAGAIAAEFDPC